MVALSAAQYTMQAQPSHVCGGPGICEYVCEPVIITPTTDLHRPQACALTQGRPGCVCVFVCVCVHFTQAAKEHLVESGETNSTSAALRHCHTQTHTHTQSCPHMQLNSLYTFTAAHMYTQTRKTL